MTEVEKKILKTQTDLVQSVLEASEKRNLERIDILILNAIKQLKMSRFKPDLTTCLSLTYLAKIQPSLFSHSSAIKETLKSLLKREQGPVNIKGKNDSMLPTLAANILIATCDGPETRSLVVGRIENWFYLNSKTTDLIQHLLATLCIKCDSEVDAPTINCVINFRQHWLQYLEDNYQFYGPVPKHLSTRIRVFLYTETNCESILNYIRFLSKHDGDIERLALEVSLGFVITRPLSKREFLSNPEFGSQLNKSLLKLYSDLFSKLKNNEQPKLEDSETKDPDLVYISFPGIRNRIIVINKKIIEAVLTMLTTVQADGDCGDEYMSLYSHLFIPGKLAESVDIYQDCAKIKPYELPFDLRLKLAQSSDERFLDFAIKNADIKDVIGLIQSFGFPTTTLTRLLKVLESIEDTELIKSAIYEQFFFSRILRFFSIIGVAGSGELLARLGFDL